MTEQTKAPVERWNVDSVRLTIFSTTFGRLVPGAWRAITGDDPETTATQPKVGTSQEQGPVPAGVLVAQQGPDRIDLVLVPPLIDPTQLPSLGSFDDAVAAFSKLVEEWVSKLDGNRLAFGVTLRLPVANKEDGYRLLGAYLPFRPDVASSDLLYQINRRRMSVAVGLQVNRLSKWSVNFAQTFSVGSMSPVPQFSIQDSRHMCRLEIDINTAVDPTASIDGPKVVKLFGEFAAMAREIVEQGDIP